MIRFSSYNFYTQKPRSWLNCPWLFFQIRVVSLRWWADVRQLLEDVILMLLQEVKILISIFLCRWQLICFSDCSIYQRVRCSNKEMPVCGSDGKSYRNMCRFHVARCAAKKSRSLTVAYGGWCLKGEGSSRRLLQFNLTIVPLCFIFTLNKYISP